MFRSFQMLTSKTMAKAYALDRINQNLCSYARFSWNMCIQNQPSFIIMKWVKRRRNWIICLEWNMQHKINEFYLCFMWIITAFVIPFGISNKNFITRNVFPKWQKMRCDCCVKIECVFFVLLFHIANSQKHIVFISLSQRMCLHAIVFLSLSLRHCRGGARNYLRAVLQ